LGKQRINNIEIGTRQFVEGKLPCEKGKTKEQRVTSNQDESRLEMY